MPLTKKTSGNVKEFKNAAGETVSFYYIPDKEETNNSSVFTFEDEEIVRQQFWYPHIKKGDVILDIGASFGSYTLSALALGATVYSFSPEHEFPKIRASVEENRGFRQRCHIFNFGFHNDTGLFKTDSAAFFKVGEMSEQQIRRVNDNNFCGWYIPVKKLDDFVSNTPNIGKIDFIKIDTEGAEYNILVGGIKTLKRYRPKLLVEFHLFKDQNIAAKCHELLTEIGYEGKASAYHANNISHGFYVYPVDGTADAASD